MPNPVTVARQYLTEEAGRALDEAVLVAYRRNHGQTTSLHAVFALLALPASTLREACSRVVTSTNSYHRPFRTLVLCVRASLDGLPKAKTMEKDPPISNSLMAAIKRAQAYQRRHPDNFHMYQMHCNQQTASFLKVDMKHFVLSILDDPIVSRVFGKAGIRNWDLKLAIRDSKFSLSFQFSDGFEVGGGHGSCRRIGEALMKRNDGKGKFLLLIGFGASNALNGFVDCVNNDNEEMVVLPDGIEGLNVISIEKAVVEFVNEGGCGDKEKMWIKFEELTEELNRFSGQGIVVNLGDFKVLEGENLCSDAVSFLVLKLTALLESFREKLWLMGAAATYETYLKFVRRFPYVEKHWDISILPITSYKNPFDGFGSKSSLMGSFVPFGGFFSAPSEFKIPSSSVNASITRHICNADYEQEVAAILQIGSTMSVADRHSDNLPSWLRMTDLDRRKTLDAAKANDYLLALRAKILGMQKPCQQRSYLDLNRPAEETENNVMELERSSQFSREAHKSPSSSLDLNLPVEETEDYAN